MSNFFARSEVRSATISVGLVLAGLALLFFVAIPGINQALALQREISREEKRLSLLKEKTQKLADFAKQSDTLDKEFSLFDQAIPSANKVPELLTEIQAASNVAGVKITALQFGGDTQKQAGTLREVRLRYSAEGAFVSALRLVETFEKASRLIDLESLRYTLRIDMATGVGTIILDATLLSRYTLEPILNSENPIIFSFSDPNYIQNAKILKTLTVY